MDFELITLDSDSATFREDFFKYKAKFLSIISKSLKIYYGNKYQLDRITEGSFLYVVLKENKVIGVSYVKKNNRRGIVAVYPEKFRRLGLAEAMIKKSLLDLSKQYSIVSFENRKIIQLLKKVGFKIAQSKQEIKNILESEFELLFDFKIIDGSLVFSRKSLKRKIFREKLVLLYINY